MYCLLVWATRRSFFLPTNIQGSTTFRSLWHGQHADATDATDAAGGVDVKTLNRYLSNEKLGGGFKDFLFSPLPGEMIQFD